MKTAAVTGNPKDFVTSLERGLKVIQSFDAEHKAMSLSEVALRTGLSRAGARRFLLTLEALGFVSRQGRLFSLTPRVLDLGYAFLASMPIWERSQTYLNEVTSLTGESSSLAVLDDEDVVYIARSTAQRLLMVGIHVGSRLPAHCTSMGRVLLAGQDDEQVSGFLSRVKLSRRTEWTITDASLLRAELEKIRRQGYAMLDQELEEGLCSLAVPVHDSNNTVVAAINISTNAAIITKEKLLSEFLPVLQEASTKIQNAILP